MLLLFNQTLRIMCKGLLVSVVLLLGYQKSRMKLTGPSLTSETFISAPKMPV